VQALASDWLCSGSWTGPPRRSSTGSARDFYSVSRISAHLGRHAILLHAAALEELRGKLLEPVVFDHFETFEFTQDFPFGVATAVGARSTRRLTAEPA